jgi:hypothetical protein
MKPPLIHAVSVARFSANATTLSSSNTILPKRASDGTAVTVANFPWPL